MCGVPLREPHTVDFGHSVRSGSFSNNVLLWTNNWHFCYSMSARRMKIDMNVYPWLIKFNRRYHPRAAQPMVWPTVRFNLYPPSIEIC